MINSSLQAFASNVQKAGRISFGDVQRLQRDILPDGISSRAQAELLLTLDQSVRRADRAFADWLVAMMVDFVVWGTRPTGVIDGETAAWLTPFLGGQRTRTMRRLARELAAEADHGGTALPPPCFERYVGGPRISAGHHGANAAGCLRLSVTDLRRGGWSLALAFLF